MIDFSCSCGKKYRLPDRNAEREVRCNQCEKTLIVPKQSQTEPVIPVVEPEKVEPMIEPTIESAIEPNVEQSAAPEPVVVEKENPFVQPTESEQPSDSVPEKHVEKRDEEEIAETVAEPSKTEKSSFVFDVQLPSGRTLSLCNYRGSGVVSCGILICLLLLPLIGIGVGGVFLGRLTVNTTPPSSGEAQERTPIIANVSSPESSTLSAGDWTVSEDSLPFFDIRTADGVAATLSLDGDPTMAKSDKQSTLDLIAVDLDDSRSTDGAETHTVSFRIDSESGEDLCVVWPKSRNAGLDETEIKGLKFCIYFSGAVKLDDFRLRIGDGFGDTEFILTERERNLLCEKGRMAWFAVSVPIDGDERWQRTERGRMTPKTVDFIEFRAKPTGNGVTFWIDNCNVVRP